MAKAIMVLAPDMARQEIVQRRDGATPRNVIAHFQPFGVLVATDPAYRASLTEKKFWQDRD